MIAEHAAYYCQQTQPWRCIARDSAALERLGIYNEVVELVEQRLR